MTGHFLEAYQSLTNYHDKIKSTKILKVSYLIKLSTQRNSITDLEIKHKAWAEKQHV